MATMFRLPSFLHRINNQVLLVRNRMQLLDINDENIKSHARQRSAQAPG